MKEYQTTENGLDMNRDPGRQRDSECSENREGAPEYDASSPVSGGKKKVRKKKKRKKKRYLLKLLILLLLCIGLYFFLHSSIFTIKTIEVSKSSHFTAQQVLQMAGLKSGMNLFDYRAGKCEDKLAENPYIQSAKVKRSLPGTVKIELSERQELAVVAHGKKYVVIDGGGTVLQIVDKLPKLTLLIGLSVTDSQEGEEIGIKESSAFKKSMDILNTMEETDLYFKKIDVSEVVAKAYVKDKLFCRGKPKNLVACMEEGKLQMVLYDLHKRGIKQAVVNVGNDLSCSYKKIK